VGTIIFHAGMSKCGSTTLQIWLKQHLPLLREAGIEPLRIRQPTPDSPVAVLSSTTTLVLGSLPN
jgi:hypothetical protein